MIFRIVLIKIIIRFENVLKYSKYYKRVKVRVYKV